MGAMRSQLAAAVILSALAAAPGVRAEPVVALRLGIAPAVGSPTADVPVSEALTLQVPVQVDALWRAGRLATGVYGSWGVARYGACGGGSCGASVARLGVEALWSFAPFAPLAAAEPWVGVGAGYEWASASRARSGASLATSWRGPELFQAQGGVEWRRGRRLAIGPFLLVGAGRYTRLALDTGVDSASADVARKAVHAWVHVGVRGRLALGRTP
jgi:hypothetical protein